MLKITTTFLLSIFILTKVGNTSPALNINKVFVNSNGTYFTGIIVGDEYLHYIKDINNNINKSNNTQYSLSLNNTSKVKIPIITIEDLSNLRLNQRRKFVR